MSYNSNCPCTETQETTYVCGECQTTTPCDCPIIDLSTDCVLYTGDTIQCQNTDVVVKNTNATTAFKNFSDFFCQKLSEIANRFRIVNIGTGAKVYKQENLLGQKELRTITSSDTSITIVEGATTIDLSVPDYPIVPTASNVGTGAGVFKELSTNDYKFRRIKTENSGTGNTILKAQVENTNDISLIAKTLLLESQGAGTSLIKDLQLNTDDNKIRLKSIKSSNSSIVITPGTDEIDLTVINADNYEAIIIPISDLFTNLSTGTNVNYFRIPFGLTITSVKASVFEAQSTGAILTFDILESGVSILSTKITIDNTEKTSFTAVTPPVISDTTLSIDSEITFSILQVGTAGAKGAEITIIGTRI